MKKARIGLDSGYSRRSLARLAFSTAAAELSDQARAQVHTQADRHAAPGEFIESALALVHAADDVLHRAVVLERERGTSWVALGEALGITKQGAQQKYGPLLDQWRDALDEPLRKGRGGVVDCQLPEGPDDPARQVARLDKWIAKHREPNAPSRTVSGGLERASLVEQVAEVARHARRTVHEKDPAKRRAYYARKAAVLSQIAVAQPGNKDAAEAAMLAQTELARIDDEPPN